MTDRRYGLNKYGDGKLYGSSDPRQALAWDISIDWNDDGFFDENECDRLTGIEIVRGRSQFLLPAGEGFGSVENGTVTLTLRNDDGRFDGWNTNSPLYPNVDGGKEIRIRVRDLWGGGKYALFRGVITDITPIGYGTQDAQVQIQASDGLFYLRNYSARAAVQEHISPDEAIGMILDAVQWPSKWGRSLDASAETIRYWWATGDKKAMSEIEDIAHSFLGYFFVDANGQARFVQRTNVGESVVNYPQEYLLKDIDNPQPFAIRRNVMRLKVHPRTEVAATMIYQLVGSPIVNGGATLKVFANYTYNNQPVPAKDVSISVFQANTQSDFLGTDKTAECTATVTNFGQTGLVEITYNGGGAVYIKLELQGIPIYEPNSADVTYPSDVSTVKMPRELVLDLPWQQDVNAAVDIANVLGPYFAAGHPMPGVQIENRPSLQFSADLFDIVTADLPALGLNGQSYRVSRIEHRSDSGIANCQRVVSRIYFEPYVSSGEYMQWDTRSVWDTETVYGW